MCNKSTKEISILPIFWNLQYIFVNLFNFFYYFKSQQANSSLITKSSNFYTVLINVFWLNVWYTIMNVKEDIIATM